MEKLTEYKMPSISRTFLDWLKKYDPRLQAYWDYKQGCYVVERIGPKGEKQFVCKADYLDNRIKQFIYEQDTWRTGGMNQYLTRLELAEKAWEQKLNQQHANEHEALLSEAYDYIKFKGGEKAFLFDPIPRKKRLGSVHIKSA
jgi:hypothetical protein